VESNLGFIPEHYELTDIVNPYVEVVKHLQTRVLPRVRSGQIRAVIFDTGSEFADRLLSVELDKISSSDKRRAYTPTYQMFTTVMRMILLSGAWVVMTCHEKRGDPDEDRRGGPLLPGRLVESIPSQFSLILRATVKDTIQGRQRVYLCDPLDPDWIMGDRYGACYEEQPMELRAIMWRIGHPGEEMPAEMLAGKPIRLGGKLYKAGELPKKAVVLSSLDAPPADIVNAADVPSIEEAPQVEVAVAPSEPDAKSAVEGGLLS
jgi:hypothetical protein